MEKPSHEQQIQGLKSKWDEFAPFFQENFEKATATTAFTMLNYIKLKTVCKIFY